ncbi:hypothetical protein AB7M74_000809 [Bradyrhizobium japonicum]
MYRHARQVVHPQQRVFQIPPRHAVRLETTLDDRAQQVLTHAHAFGAVERDGLERALGDLDRDDAVGDILRRQQRARQQPAAALEHGRHLIGQRIEPFDAEALAAHRGNELLALGLWQQLHFAGEAHALHDDALAPVGDGGGRLLRSNLARGRQPFLPLHLLLPLHLAEQRSGILRDGRDCGTCYH